MRSHITRVLGLTAVALMLATTAQAQGRGKGKAKGKDRDERSEIYRRERRDDGRVIRDSNGEVYRDGRWVPPGLAKKPGQMPPGQYKKRYGTYEGATVLGDIMRRRGYDVLRIVPSGESQYVYYRLHDGPQRRAIVRPGTQRLGFVDVPTSILQAVLARLY